MIKKLLTDLEEVRAYRKLSGVPFDFGAGIVTDISTESEDAYYEMEEQNIIDQINDYFFFERGSIPIDEEKGDFHVGMSMSEIKENIDYIVKNYKNAVAMEKITEGDIGDEKFLNLEEGGKTSYKRKEQDKKRLKHMTTIRYDKENGNEYRKRYYLSGVKQTAKKVSNKKVRKYGKYTALKGAEYRKVFDYWNTVY